MVSSGGSSFATIFSDGTFSGEGRRKNLIKLPDGRRNPVHGLSFATTATGLGCMRIT